MLTWLICSYYDMIHRNVYLSLKFWSIHGLSNIGLKQALYQTVPECYGWLGHVSFTCYELYRVVVFMIYTFFSPLLYSCITYWTSCFSFIYSKQDQSSGLFGEYFVDGEICASLGAKVCSCEIQLPPGPAHSLEIQLERNTRCMYSLLESNSAKDVVLRMAGQVCIQPSQRWHF